MLVEGLFGCVSPSSLALGLTWLEPPASSRRRGGMGPLSRLLESMGLVAHMRCKMGSGRWKEADSEAIAHSGSS